MRTDCILQVCSLVANEPTFTCIISYRFSHICRTLRALQSSSKTSLRIDAEGVLSLQFLSHLRSPAGATVDSIVDFKVSHHRLAALFPPLPNAMLTVPEYR